MMHYFVYPATLTPDTQDGGFVVRFPDIPEAIAQGDDVPEALQQAADCLEEAVAGRIRRHEHIPTPSPVGSNQYVIPVPAQTAAKAALYLALRQDELTPFELALRLRCDEQEVQRLLDPMHASKLSRLEAALAAEILGVRRATLSDLLHGKTSLSPEMALRLDKAFDVSMDTLLRLQAWYDSYTMRQRADDIDVRRYEPV
jgi:antitoxin HicB